MVAHGRGVSLITGWTEPVENAFGIAAAGLVNAAGVVSRVRLQFAQDKSRSDATDNQMFLQYIVSLGAHGAHKF